MPPLRGQKIVTYHRSWVYFAHRFGLEVAAEIEPKPGVPPTAAHLAAVAETVKAQGVKIILQEPFYSRKAANRMAARRAPAWSWWPTPSAASRRRRTTWR